VDDCSFRGFPSAYNNLLCQFARSFLLAASGMSEGQGHEAEVNRRQNTCRERTNQQ
jgi:hypothetical protein